MQPHKLLNSFLALWPAATVCVAAAAADAQCNGLTNQVHMLTEFCLNGGNSQGSQQQLSFKALTLANHAAHSDTVPALLCGICQS